MPGISTAFELIELDNDTRGGICFSLHLFQEALGVKIENYFFLLSKKLLTAAICSDNQNTMGCGCDGEGTEWVVAKNRRDG